MDLEGIFLAVIGSRAPKEAPQSTQNYKAGEPDLGVFFWAMLTPLSSGTANTSKLRLLLLEILFSRGKKEFLIAWLITSY